MREPAFSGRCGCGNPTYGQADCDDCSDMIDCPECKGEGCWYDADGNIKELCDMCDAHGEIPYKQR